jgi:hypothetical protein
MNSIEILVYIYYNLIIIINNKYIIQRTSGLKKVVPKNKIYRRNV